MNQTEAEKILSEALGYPIRPGQLMVGPGLIPPYFAHPIHAIFVPEFDDEAGCGSGVGATESEALLDLLISLSKTYSFQSKEHQDEADRYQEQVKRELKWSEELQDTSDKILSSLRST